MDSQYSDFELERALFDTLPSDDSLSEVSFSSSSVSSSSSRSNSPNLEMPMPSAVDPFNSPFRPAYDEERQELYYVLKAGSPLPHIYDFSPQRFYQGKLLSLLVKHSDRHQTKSFVMVEKNKHKKFSLEDVQHLPARYEADDFVASCFSYQQVHAARQKPEFHEFIRHVPKQSTPKAKSRHLSATERKIYFSIFGVCLGCGVPLPVQNSNMSYTEATGKCIESGKITRPTNSFLTFSNSLRAMVNNILKNEDQKQKLLQMGINFHELFRESGTKTFQNAILSKALSEFWNDEMTLADKQMWDDESKVLSQLHQIQFPGYKYCPQRPNKQKTLAVVPVCMDRVPKRPSSAGNDDHRTKFIKLEPQGYMPLHSIKVEPYTRVRQPSNSSRVSPDTLSGSPSNMYMQQAQPDSPSSLMHSPPTSLMSPPSTLHQQNMVIDDTDYNTLCQPRDLRMSTSSFTFGSRTTNPMLACTVTSSQVSPSAPFQRPPSYRDSVRNMSHQSMQSQYNVDNADLAPAFDSFQDIMSDCYGMDDVYNVDTSQFIQLSSASINIY